MTQAQSSAPADDGGTRSDALYQVLVMQHGERTTTRSHVFLNFEDSGAADGVQGLSYYLWAVRNHEHTIVVDTGFSKKAAAERARNVVAPPGELLVTAGIQPARVRKVALTHGHYDHIGNVALFPSAEFVMSSAEFDFWTGPYARRPQFRHFSEPSELSQLVGLREEGRLTLFDSEIELAPGVIMTKVGGHTPGMSVVTVPTSESPVVIASDAAHFQAELDEDLLYTYMADVVNGYAALDRLRTEAGGKARILTGHDPAVLDGLPKLDAAGLIGYVGKDKRWVRPT